MTRSASTTLPALLLDRAARRPERVWAHVTVDGEEVALTLAGLAERALSFAGALAEAGVREGDVLPLAIPTSAEYLVALYGALLCGAAVAPVAPLGSSIAERARFHAYRLSSVAACAGARFAVVTREADAALSSVEQMGESGPTRLILEELAASRGVDGFPPAGVDVERTALVQFSSGSTAEPKGVRIRFRNIAENAEAVAQRSGVTAEDSMLCFLPLYHDFGFFTGVVLPMCWDVPVRLYQTSAFMRSPSFWPKAMSRTRSTLCPAPQFAYDAVLARARDRDLDGVDLSAWRVSYNGGEPVRPSTVRAFVERFARYGLDPTVVLPSYGMAEATLAVAIHPSGRPLESDVISRDALVERGVAVRADDDERSLEVCSCGPPLYGFDVTILDDEGSELDERTVGEIAIRGRSVAGEYLTRDAGEIPLVRDGWYRTGDLGYLAEGRVFVTGRAKDIVIRGGANFYPQDVERLVELVDGVRMNGVVAFGYAEDDGVDRVVAVVESNVRDEFARAELVERARRVVFDALGLGLDDVAIRERGWIPKTTSAKLQRSLARAKYLGESSAATT